MALNIDLFKYYSEALEKNNEMIRLHKAKDEQKIVRKRKIFLEVEVSEDEFFNSFYLQNGQIRYPPGTISGK